LDVKIYRDRCVAAGQCTLVAPKVFDQGEEDGIVFLVAEDPLSPELNDSAKEAAYLCPAQAIEVTE
jgi:ferredoxin